MKVVVRSKGFAIAVIALMLVLSACSGNNGNNGGNGGSGNNGGNAAGSNAGSGGNAAGTDTADAPADPLGKYDPPIDLNVGRATNSSTKFVDGESFDNNIWNTEYKDQLGVNIKNEFIVDDTQYESKVNVIIASGEIPDLMLVTAKQMKMLMDADLIYDMTDIFDKYASDMSKQAITANDKIWSAAKVDGKMMGIPMVYAIDFQLNDVWIRSDWMKKLNLPEPKTADDFLNIAKAFVTQDPDGNGKADTYGIALDKGLLSTNMGALGGWLNMFHAYKEIWTKDAGGQLVYSSIQPEMKTALQKMADLYKQGIIDQEFSVKDGGKVAEDIVSGKVGMEIGSFWNPAYPFQDLKNKDAGSDWTPYPLLSSDDKPALSQANTRIDQYYVVSKNYKHPEAIVKLLNLQFENLYGSRMDEWNKIAQSDKYKDIQTFKYPVIGMEPPDLNRTMYSEVQATIESGDESNLKLAGSKDDWKKSNDFLNGDMKGWNNYKIRYEKNGGMGVLKQQLDSGNIMYNEFYGIPGPVNVEKSATMLKLENETFTKIIMNAAPIDEFDHYVEQWKKIGGDDLTKEVNDWYASK